jgi:hypothetical protein
MVPLGFATTYVYPWHGYPFYETSVEYESIGGWGTGRGDGDCRITPFNDAWSTAIVVSSGFGAWESIHGVGVDVYPPNDVDATIWARGTYQLDGWVASLGFAHSTAAVSLQIHDYCCGQIYASELIKEQIRVIAGSYSESGNFQSESIAISLEGGHYYHVLVIARAATSQIISIAAAYAHSAIDVSLIAISVYPYGYLSHGGCPNLLVSNGRRYFDEGVMPIHNVVNPDDDIVINHRIKNKVKPLRNGCFELLLSEIAEGYEYSHSFIDYVSLVAVDANGAWHECPLIAARHSRDGGILTQLVGSDNLRAQTFKGDKITLRFSAPALPSQIRSFVFILEGHNPFKI